MIGSITKKSLETAIEHVEQNMRSAAFLESIAEPAVTATEAELVLAIIRNKFPIFRPRTIYATKSELTYTLCQHGTRKGALNTDDLYDKIIPYLESQGLVKLVQKEATDACSLFRPKSKFSKFSIW